MINKNTGKLMIFDNFVKLHAKKSVQFMRTSGSNTTSVSYTDENHRFDMSSTIFGIANQIVQFGSVHAEDLYIFQNGAEQFSDNELRHTRIQRILKSFIHNWRVMLKNPFKYFEAIKMSQTALKQLTDEGAKKFEILLNLAKTCHQEALVDKLEDEKERISKELAILTAGIKTYVSEEDMIKAFTVAPRKIRLDWIKNFTRFIPEELQQIIEYTYAQDLFDNYVVLHYDPDNKGSEMTTKEKKKAADPILFGVIEKSRRLYYLGDWIDEYCDLTLTKLLDIINEKHEDRQLKTVIAE